MTKHRVYRISLLSAPFVLSIVAAFALLPTLASASGGSFIGGFQHNEVVATTVPSNGDINPYGTFVVPRSHGKLVQGDVLVSNFNNSNNLQGTGTTIVQIPPDERNVTTPADVFSQLSADQLNGTCPGGVGLTTALVVLKRGWVIVGSLPTSDGTSATAQPGCLIVINSWGNPVETFSGGDINGPWDMTVADYGDKADLFVSNVFTTSATAVDTGNILRIKLDVPEQGDGVPQIDSTRVIGTFPTRTDPAAVFVGPTGLGLGKDDTLYVANSEESAINAIHDASDRQSSAGEGDQITENGFLNDPLGLTIAPNGDILTVNGGDGHIVETTRGGTQLTEFLLDNTVVQGSPNGAGCLFGLAIDWDKDAVLYVDDCSNTLNIFH
jgi:hypothetical protein